MRIFTFIFPVIMNNFRIFLLLLAILLVLFTTTGCAQSFRKRMLNNLQQVDINRYTGKWYEIARFPHRFERGLVGVTATYNLKPDGKIEVINQGFQDSLNGPLRTAVGKAKIVSKEGKGHLKVSFFWIFYADYFILALDQENYNYALIGSSTPDFLWVLSRTPKIEPELLDKILKRAEELGYDLSKVELVEQAE
jgi:apolipoprotein D and lipocalin family protein